ncbi:MAG: leucyl aminopeptidase [Reinekea sp.]|jgi:leucyl aminopeptidase
MANVQTGKSGIPLQLIATAEYDEWFVQQSEFTCNWLMHSGFKTPGFALLPNSTGNPGSVIVVADDADSCWALADAALALPAAHYHYAGPEARQQSAGLGWILGQYQFNRYLDSGQPQALLYLSSAEAVHQAHLLADGVCLTRDLVNTPAGDMMPQHLASLMTTMATEFDADFSQLVGDELLAHNYPTIHMVGRASEHAPRLLDLSWGDPSHPKLTVVGKGVCFDSGGLDLKSAAGMRLMKKDMGGAAHALGLATLIMSRNLPVRLRVLIPAVENAVSSNAFRPGDVVKTRKGLTVEIDNTDAEGRLVLCDALAEAEMDNPDLIIDFATLTGAARIALGLEVPAFYSTDAAFAQALTVAGADHEDPLWQMPLHQGYGDYMVGTISDLVNSAPVPYGGSITAALFLQHFVEHSPWVHIDVGAWNNRQRPGRPMGGEAMGLRAVFAALNQRYS